MTNQNVKNSGSGKPKKQAVSNARLERLTIKTSREMDFFSEKELVTQTGHHISEWPQVILKELIDNSLDACEEADIAPVIHVEADASGISVSDNGPGLPESTLQGALDYSIRASSRETYVAPDRGAQGNALKTLLPMPHVLDPGHGKLIVLAHDKRHAITCGADPISQRALIHDDVAAVHTRGTTVRAEWSPRTDQAGGAAWPFAGATAQQFYLPVRDLLEGFALFNAHTSIHLDWFGQKTTWEATDPSWQKWKPNKPTSSHWYQLAHFERLIGAYITHDRAAGTDRLISDFLKGFDGLTGSANRAKVLNDTGLKRVFLSALVTDGRFDSDRTGMLLHAMQRHTRPVKSATLGVIGEAHLRARLLAMGVRPESFRYSKKLGDAKSKKPQLAPEEKASCSALPGVLESAFGWLGDDSPDSRRIFTGANWSAAIGNPFRSFGTTGEGLESVLAKQRATRDEPVVFVLHLAQPRIEYTDRGKSALVIGGDA